MNYICTAVISYLIGSLNVAYFISKANGFDIRERGSNNAGIFTGLCDLAKAVATIKLCGYLFPGNEIIPFLAGAMAIIGHIFPFYMGFRGGKGFSSYIGMMVAVNFFPVAVMVMAVTVVVTLLSNYIAIGTFAALLIAPVYYIVTKASIWVITIVTGISLLIACKHAINIRRIINHQEIGFREKTRNK